MYISTLGTAYWCVWQSPPACYTLGKLPGTLALFLIWAHIKSSTFCHLSTLDTTYARKDNRPSAFFVKSKRRGPWNEARTSCNKTPKALDLGPGYGGSFQRGPFFCFGATCRKWIPVPAILVKKEPLQSNLLLKTMVVDTLSFLGELGLANTYHEAYCGHDQPF